MENNKGIFIMPKSDFAFRELLEIETVRKYFISDITGISLEKIKDTKLMNTFLRRSFKQQKLGVVDALIEMRDGTRITVEIQLKKIRSWEKRQMFYWAKTFVKDLLLGENYGKLKKCISIAILDFDLTDRPGAHKVYKLRDEEGNLFSDLQELHTIELGKTAPEGSAVGEWIEFFNAKEEEDFNMLMSKTKNEGIREAISAVRRYGLLYKFRTYLEYKEKARRDRWAEDEYLKEEAIKSGWEEGMAAGMQAGKIAGIEAGMAAGMAAGKTEGMARLNQLYAILQEQGRTEELLRAIQDEDYREKLFQEINL